MSSFVCRGDCVAPTSACLTYTEAILLSFIVHADIALFTKASESLEEGGGGGGGVTNWYTGQLARTFRQLRNCRAKRYQRNRGCSELASDATRALFFRAVKNVQFLCSPVLCQENVRALVSYLQVRELGGGGGGIARRRPFGMSKFVPLPPPPPLSPPSQLPSPCLSGPSFPSRAVLPC